MNPDKYPFEVYNDHVPLSKPSSGVHKLIRTHHIGEMQFEFDSKETDKIFINESTKNDSHNNSYSKSIFNNTLQKNFKKLDEALNNFKTYHQEPQQDQSEIQIPDEFSDYEPNNTINENVVKYSGRVHLTEENTDSNAINICQESKRKNHKRIGRSRKKSKGSKHPKSFLSAKEKIMIKTIPLFFSSNNEDNEEDDINLGESVYTQISKEMLSKDKNIKASRIYEELTNESAIKTAVERRSGKKKNNKVLQRLYSPPSKDTLHESQIIQNM